ncbi:hypothetical protein CC2G_007442 [Coprinopsis cinerea AmutBmut pab1-1]|nr:hypothetical protein CC2G_007442 [Coprinopsis cinerea AmutBmut pab1-1]
MTTVYQSTVTLTSPSGEQFVFEVSSTKPNPERRLVINTREENGKTIIRPIVDELSSTTSPIVFNEDVNHAVDESLVDVKEPWSLPQPPSMLEEPSTFLKGYDSDTDSDDEEQAMASFCKRLRRAAKFPRLSIKSRDSYYNSDSEDVDDEETPSSYWNSHKSKTTSKPKCTFDRKAVLTFGSSTPPVKRRLRTRTTKSTANGSITICWSSLD